MKIFTKYSTILIVLFAFLAAPSLQAQDWSKDQKEVLEIIENAWAKWQEGDFDASVESIHEKYIGWNQEDPLPTSKAKWVKSIEKMKDYVKLIDYDIEPARILVYDDVAVVHYYFEQTMAYTKDDKTTEINFKGKNAEFLIKEGGKWLLIGDMTFWKTKK